MPVTPSINDLLADVTRLRAALQRIADWPQPVDMTHRQLAAIAKEALGEQGACGKKATREDFERLAASLPPLPTTVMATARAPVGHLGTCVDCPTPKECERSGCRGPEPTEAEVEAVAEALYKANDGYPIKYEAARKAIAMGARKR